MGIRFRCHYCNQQLNVKDHLAGRRGKCPGCSGSFRIPMHDADLSMPLDEPLLSISNAESTKPTSAPSVKSPTAKLHSSKSPATQPLSLNEAKGLRSKADAVFVSPQAESSAAPAKVKSDAAPVSTREPVAELPASLIPWIDARWFVRPPSGGQYGPATTHMLADWIAERRITPETFLWRDGMESWQVATDVVPEAFASPAAGSAIAPAPPAVETLPNVPDLAREVSKGSLAAAKAALAIKRKRQKVRSWVVLGLLAAIALGLVATLIVVLWR